MNLAKDWPAMHGVDMRSPEELAIDKAAKFVAAEPTQQRRHQALFQLRAKYSQRVYDLIETRARELHKKRGDNR